MKGGGSLMPVLAFSADGKRLASFSFRPCIWDVATGEEAEVTLPRQHYQRRGNAQRPMAGRGNRGYNHPGDRSGGKQGRPGVEHAGGDVGGGLHVALTSDGKTVVAWGDLFVRGRGRISYVPKCLDVATGKILRTYVPPRGMLGRARVSQ